MNTFTFRWLLTALALLAVEVAIARYAPQCVFRGFGGDVLVVYALRETASCAAGTVGLVDVLGLRDQTALYRVLRIALGATFDVWDLVARGCGWLVCRALDLPKFMSR